MMIIATLELSLIIRQARSLKDKRRAVGSLKRRLQNEFNISVAEIDYQDQVQRALLGLAMVGNEQRFLDSALSRVRRYVELDPRTELAYSESDFL